MRANDFKVGDDVINYNTGEVMQLIEIDNELYFEAENGDLHCYLDSDIWSFYR